MRDALDETEFPEFPPPPPYPPPQPSETTEERSGPLYDFSRDNNLIISFLAYFIGMFVLLCDGSRSATEKKSPFAYKMIT